MPGREQGLRRVGVVTTGLAAAGIVGSLALAAVARADTEAPDASTMVDQSTSDTGPEAGSQPSQQSQQSGPRLSSGKGPADAKSGGS
jgi:hypothetical protein